jgi:hypothetical protein
MMLINIPIAISWPKDLISKIDSQRGDISRSKYLFRIVEKSFETTNKDEIKGHKKQVMDLLEGGLGGLQSSKSTVT